jgi:hypothetical protein
MRIIFPLEADVAVFERAQAVVGDGNGVGVAVQISGDQMGELSIAVLSVKRVRLPFAVSYNQMSVLWCCRLARATVLASAESCNGEYSGNDSE